jgi:hypothetical protein
VSKLTDNPYSKYRYDNNFNPKFRVENSTTKMFGIDQRSYKQNIKSQMPAVSPSWVNNGATWVLNNVFKFNQVNQVDQSVNYGKSPIKLMFFTLFKL